MTLQKQKKLRKIEFIYTNGKINDSCHMVYHDVISEDGVEIAKKVHRETKKTIDIKDNLLKEILPPAPGIQP